METPVFRRIAFTSTYFQEALEIRDRILRQPLGLVFEPADLALEEDNLHLACFLGEKVIATLQLASDERPTVLKMRQVAVDEPYQRQGIGRDLVKFSEKEARTQGAESLFLHARAPVVPFYEKIGYQCCGESFLEVTIPHYPMIKDL